jgi:hypothetical protein
MRDSLGEVERLDSQPPRPPCDSALMRVAAYGFVFFIYENPFPGSRYMHIGITSSKSLRVTKWVIARLGDVAKCHPIFSAGP